MAEGYLPEADAWSEKSHALRKQILKDIRDPGKRSSAGFKRTVVEKLKALKADYVAAYMTRHKKARLDHAQDKTRARSQGITG